MRTAKTIINSLMPITILKGQNQAKVNKDINLMKNFQREMKRKMMEQKTMKDSLLMHVEY